MAKTKPRSPRKKRTKPGFLPGMAPPVIQKIEDAADNYYEAMMERVKLSEEEAEKKDALIDAMKENGIDRYECTDGLVVTVTAKANVTVKKKKDVETNGQEE